mmetsp:Transcript_31663/g.42049  ORF Transcript_31663/g.42049 Transcript_31663/m.42049 type:complete len:97 (-) Transcript_31663:1046-1336(-)
MDKTCHGGMRYGRTANMTKFIKRKSNCSQDRDVEQEHFWNPNMNQSNVPLEYLHMSVIIVKCNRISDSPHIISRQGLKWCKWLMQALQQFRIFLFT